MSDLGLMGDVRGQKIRLSRKFLLVILSSAIAFTMTQPVWAKETERQAGREQRRKDKAAYLLAQGVAQVTGVEVIQTESGLELVLETVAGSERLVPLILPEGNDLVIDILDATLAFSIRNGVTELNPAPGISSVTVNEAESNSIRVRITGESQTPSAEVVTGREDLVLSITPDRTTAADEPDDSINVIATGQGVEEEEYFVPDADIGGRINAPLRDVPQSIQVIPQEVIEDQQATGLEEVLENAAGVTFLGNDDGRGLEFAIRGFENVPILRDGFRLSEFGASAAAPEVANLERVEILKGPASVLFGQAEPGGLINTVTKKPLSEPNYDLQFQVGNRNFISPSIDLSGPLTGDGRLLYRLNALYRTEDSFRDYDSSFDRFFIAPTLAWQIGDRTDLTVNFEYINDDNPYDVGTVASGDGIADIPLERVTNNPDNTIEKEYVDVGYTLEHSFSDNWQLRNRFRYVNSTFDFGVFTRLLALDESTGELNRTFSRQFNETDTYALYTNIQGKFNTGSVKHTLLFGVDLERVDSEGESRASRDPAFLTPINIFNPDYFAVPTPALEDIPVFPGANSNNTTTDGLGIYLQDRIDLLDNLIVAARLRYDIVDSETTNIVTDEETNQDDDALTPNIGIVYQPIEPISLYANYSQSFVPNTSTDIDGEPLEPESGEGFEIGIKSDIIENRLSSTLAYFNITKQNVATDDPNDPFSSVATGEQQSQGIDLNLSGKIAPGWNIIANYAYIDAVVTEDNDLEIVDSRLAGIPEHSASLWTTYELQSGNLQGLGFGAGFNFVGERQGDLANSFEVDSYFLANAAIFYRRNNWQARLNFDNLFDNDYIESVGNSRLNGIYPGNPFTVRASVSAEF